MMNALTQRLGIDFPLLQAGMGGIAGPALAAATANAGAGGVLGLYRAAPQLIAELVMQTRQLTARPFGVNLIPELMAPQALAAQVGAALQASDRGVFLTFFGLPDREACAMVKAADRALLIMVGSITDMASALALGADAVILQGTEAGGHLLGDLRLDDLVDEALRRGCPVPLVAAGGIASGRRLRELHRRGIAGCLCGTLFVATQESRAHPRFKQRLVEAGAQDTVVTEVFDIGWPGRRHRVLRNTLTTPEGGTLRKEFIAHVVVDGRRHPLTRYSAMVPTLQTEGRIDEMAMYCGESVAGVTRIASARECVQTFIDEFHAQA